MKAMGRGVTICPREDFGPLATKRSSRLPGAHANRYEYRVWGRHVRARERLRTLASPHREETVEDCYLLTDDPSWNVKVRGDHLKLKRLVSEDKGFERWVSGRYQKASDTPHPFDELFDRLGLRRLAKGKAHDLRKAVEDTGAALGAVAVFVTKHRVRFRIGGLRAEITDIEVDGEDTVLHTLSIEGDDLDELRALQRDLGLRGEPNVAVHEYLGEDDLA